MPPQGPSNLHSEQMYFTACTLQRWLRPIGALQLGHGNEVLSLSTRGIPEDVQNFALFAANVPLDLLPCEVPFLALIVGFTMLLLAVPLFSIGKC